MSQVAEQLDPLAADFEEFRRNPAFGGGALGRAREAGARAVPRARVSDDAAGRVEAHQPRAAGRRAVRARATGEEVARAQDLEPFLFGDAVPAQVVVVNGRVSEVARPGRRAATA